MAYLCQECHRVHPIGVRDCEEARRINKEYWEKLNRRVEQHRKICRGCPDPEQHVRNLDELDNPPKEPARYAAHR